MLIPSQDLYNIVFKESPELMNVKQLSSLLDVSTKTVYCLIKQKKLQTTKVGREYRVPKYELLRYFDIVSADIEQAP